MKHSGLIANLLNVIPITQNWPKLTVFQH